MRKTLLFLMLLSVKLTFGQVSDDFNDGNFTSNPNWFGAANSFSVNTSTQLQTLLSANNQQVSLYTKSLLALNCSWEFLIQLNFDPSSSNQAKIYLISNEINLAGSLDGYFVQIGENGSTDSYDLYVQTGTTARKIIDGPSKLRANANQLLARIRVTRSETGHWSLYTDISGGNNFNLDGEATDLTHSYTDWFGVSCKYTATRSDGFIFDDFKINELNPDRKAPTIISAKALTENTVEVVFSERVEQLSALATINYRLTNLGHPHQVSSTKLPNVYLLNYTSSLSTGDHQLNAEGIKDIAGNTIAPQSAVSFFYLKPYPLKVGDILLSEILVNPKAGGVDFIEIYNNSNEILDLKGLQLANADGNGNAANAKNVTISSVYINPKSYWVLTTNPSDIKQRYHVKYPAQFVEMTSLPAYNNEKGTVVLIAPDGILDRINYTDKMHNPLLRDADGVSLERISFRNGVNVDGNFTSAAMSTGFATPTYRNSQEENFEVMRDAVALSHKIFSPDDDGFEDLLTINYRFNTNGNFANVTIYNDKGGLVRKLERNITIGTEGSFNWDGRNDAGQLSKIGIYLVRFDIFGLNGKTNSFKTACVLAAKLN